MKNPLDAVKIFLGVVCVTGAFLAAVLAPGAQPAPNAPSAPPASAAPAPSGSPRPGAG